MQSNFHGPSNDLSEVEISQGIHNILKAMHFVPDSAEVPASQQQQSDGLTSSVLSALRDERVSGRTSSPLSRIFSDKQYSTFRTVQSVDYSRWQSASTSQTSIKHECSHQLDAQESDWVQQVRKQVSTQKKPNHSLASQVRNLAGFVLDLKQTLGKPGIQRMLNWLKGYDGTLRNDEVAVTRTSFMTVLSDPVAFEGNSFW